MTNHNQTPGWPSGGVTHLLGAVYVTICSRYTPAPDIEIVYKTLIEIEGNVT